MFSHGDSVLPEIYTIQLEELVSHGYIAVSVYHTYGAAATLFPDGQLAEQSELYSRASWQSKAEVCVQDIVFVLDQLEKINLNDPEGVFSAHVPELMRETRKSVNLGQKSAPTHVPSQQL